MSKPLSEQWHEAASEWVEAEAIATAFEETKSAILSQWIAELGDMPVSKAEAKVKSQDRWMDHVKSIVKARTDANRAKINMEYLRLRFMEWQSQEANHRAEARL